MKTFNCINCGKTQSEKRNTQNKYCDNKCQQEYQYSRYITDWKAGKEPGTRGKALQLSSYVRKYMLDRENNTCENCGWNALHPDDNFPLVEIDHIDGDASNNSEDNLRVLCPNCHSMTSTFRSRNSNSKRQR